MQIAIVAILLVAVTAVSAFHEKYRKHMEQSPCYGFISQFTDSGNNCTHFKSDKYSDEDFESTIQGMIDQLKEKHIGGDFDENKTHVCEKIMRVKMCYLEAHKMLAEDNSLICEPLNEAADKIEDVKVRDEVNAAIAKACEVKSTLPVPAMEQVGELFRSLMEICTTEQQKELIKKCQKKIAEGETPEQAIEEVLAEAKEEEEAAAAGSEGAEEEEAEEEEAEEEKAEEEEAGEEEAAAPEEEAPAAE